MSEMQHYFEVYDRGSWIRQPGVFPTFLKAQDAAIENGRRPYRIKREAKPQSVVKESA